MRLMPTTTVGRKLAMAASGQFMVFYVTAHVLGNTTIFAGAINAYADGLRHGPFILVLWSSRTLLLLSAALHIYYGIVLKLENWGAKPEAYAVRGYRSATVAGRTMIWSGVVIAAFLLFHILHFTLQAIVPGLAAKTHPDALGRPDVLSMVVGNFRHAGIAAIYVIGVFALGLHLYHGIQSSVQTEGLNNERTLPLFTKAGIIASVLLFLGYAAIPVAILTGLLNHR